MHHANLRHYEFMRRCLEELPAAFRKRRVGFVLSRYPKDGFLRFCSAVRPCLVIGDENPLRGAERSKARVAAQLRVPFWTVDSDVIVLTRLLGKEHYAARTIRPKIQAQLANFLKPPANPSARNEWRNRGQWRSLEADGTLLERLPVDGTVSPVATFAAGERAAGQALARFLRTRLKGYALNRNKAEIEGTSRLSPYLHFGQIGAHTVALAVRDADAPSDDRKAFLEELIVRRELAMNFVRYNSHYDRFAASEPWADRTLRQHAKDTRTFTYNEKQLETAETHDPLWKRRKSRWC